MTHRRYSPNSPVTGLGPRAANRGYVLVWRYRDNEVQQFSDIIAFPAPFTAGANVAAGLFRHPPTERDDRAKIGSDRDILLITACSLP